MTWLLGRLQTAPGGRRAVGARSFAPPITARTAEPRHVHRRDRTLASAYDSRRNNFTFLRFVLATTVIWSHSYTLAGDSDPVWTVSQQIDGGSIAVDGFFVLSGFLIAQSWLQQPTFRAFGVKRALRLVPALLVATVFGAFVIGPLGSAVPLRDYLLSSGPWLHFLGVPFARYLFVPQVFVTNPHPYLLNSPLWSLRYEMLCYALVALLGIAAGRRFATIALAVFFVAWVTYIVLPPSISPLSIASQTPRLLAAFFVGVTLFVFQSYVPTTPILAIVSVVALAVATIAGGVRSVLPLAGGYLLIYFGCQPRMNLDSFGRYGDFSYGLYIFACPIQQLLLYRFGPQLSPSSLFAVAFVPTLVLAALSWYFIEAPALALKTKFARASARR